MMNITVPVAPSISVLINGVPIGPLQRFSEKIVRDLKLIRPLASTENREFYRGAEEYIVQLRYIRPLNTLLTDADCPMHELQNFKIHIDLVDRLIVFESCELESLETSCDTAGSMICDAVIHALHRTETR